ncbi:MAG: 2-succinyl-5-enolpyruvyl-6-hydroxy-3-cyclohexene-1-carboxylic-acid synthase [Candidatus Nanopelagicales bacterium]
MNSPAIARAVVEELLAAGVADVVVCPGSRSAPLTLTLADTECRGLVRLHVRIDERSGAYLALGIAKVSGRPVAVVTTSGTAAVNMHPAIVEAAYSGIPLVAVTADRPGEMRGSGANQTIDQRALYGNDVVTWADLEGLSESALRSAVAGALSLAISQPGPVHLNVPLPEPLVEPGAHAVDDVTTRKQADAPTPTGALLSTLLPAGIDASRGLLIAGDFDDEPARQAAAALANAMGWPVISEPSGNLSAHDHALRHGPLVLASPFAEGHVAEVVVTVGRVGLHRSVMRTLRSARAHIAVDVPPRLGRVDPARTASVVDAVPVADAAADPAWLADWQRADSAAGDAVAAEMTGSDLTGAAVAATVARHASTDDLLVVGASFPVRHVSSYAGAIRARCIGNRGTSGIDGVMSTAWGAALAHDGGTTYALVGDLTAIYDRNGLLAAPGERRPDLVYVVADNDGGGIFSSLEQGAPAYATDFERVFGTPHGADLAELLTAPGVAIASVTSMDELQAALESASGGVHVIVARCAARTDEQQQALAIQQAVNAALK